MLFPISSQDNSFHNVKLVLNQVIYLDSRLVFLVLQLSPRHIFIHFLVLKYQHRSLYLRHCAPNGKDFLWL